MRVKEWQNDVVFLHEIAPGVADRSYGIHVGQLAGLPASVVARAEALLSRLEKADNGSKTALTDDLPLFAVTQTQRVAPKGPGPIDVAMNEINPDSLTPLQALEFLYKLKGLALDEE